MKRLQTSQNKMHLYVITIWLTLVYGIYKSSSYYYYFFGNREKKTMINGHVVKLLKTSVESLNHWVFSWIERQQQ